MKRYIAITIMLLVGWIPSSAADNCPNSGHGGVKTCDTPTTPRPVPVPAEPDYTG